MKKMCLVIFLLCSVCGNAFANTGKLKVLASNTTHKKMSHVKVDHVKKGFSNQLTLNNAGFLN